ncbi:MAG TPA: protein translocase subunit SecD [Actinobacteria bacterium]|nr:protein translocase subunit SecD [Actinomycetota bacterium]
MATSTYQPSRALLILGVVLLVLAAWVFWPFSDAPRTPNLGLDLRGGTSVTLQPKKGQAEITQGQIDQAVGIIRQRVDSIGVAEAQVTTQGQGANQIVVVSVPGVTQKRIVDLVGQTAQLNFRPVLQEGAPGPTVAKGKKAAASPALPIESSNPAAPNFVAKSRALDCTQAQNRVSTRPDNPKLYLTTCEQKGGAKFGLGPAAVEGKTISGANATLRSQGVGEWIVTLEFDSQGTRDFAKSTQELVGKQSPQNQFAIVLDGLVVSAPRVNEAITGGQAEISGGFTQQSAQDLANVLKFGALPVAFEVAEVNSVSATLGQDQLTAGLLAGGLGLLLVVLYLLLYYRALGLVAVFSLVVAAVLTYLLFVVLGRALGFTLTLAGIAGAIVAIGITADSFIVYFERIRDEVRDRKSLRVATELGWARARRTILAADFVSLLAAGVLYFVSVGNVRGFAFVLGLTTLIDIAVVFLFTRPMVSLLANRPFFAQGRPLSGVDPRRLGVDVPDAKKHNTSSVEGELV